MSFESEKENGKSVSLLQNWTVFVCLTSNCQSQFLQLLKAIPLGCIQGDGEAWNTRQEWQCQIQTSPKSNQSKNDSVSLSLSVSDWLLDYWIIKSNQIKAKYLRQIVDAPCKTVTSELLLHGPWVSLSLSCPDTMHLLVRILMSSSGTFPPNLVLYFTDWQQQAASGPLCTAHSKNVRQSVTFRTEFRRISFIILDSEILNLEELNTGGCANPQAASESNHHDRVWQVDSKLSLSLFQTPSESECFFLPSAESYNHNLW